MGGQSAIQMYHPSQCGEAYDAVLMVAHPTVSGISQLYQPSHQCVLPLAKHWYIACLEMKKKDEADFTGIWSKNVQGDR